MDLDGCSLNALFGACGGGGIVRHMHFHASESLQYSGVSENFESINSLHNERMIFDTLNMRIPFSPVPVTPFPLSLSSNFHR